LRKLLEFVRREQFDRVGVFTYSREENTDAFEMAGKCPSGSSVNGGRPDGSASGDFIEKNRDLVGREIEVLVEGSTAGRATRLRGRTPAQAPEIDGMVILKGDAQPGDFVRARVERALSYDSPCGGVERE